MSILDELKAELEKTSIKPSEINNVLGALSRRYGGSFPYVRKREAKKK
jgi:hypothetical protein